MANDKNTRQLIRRMLDKGSLLPETAEELQEYLEELDKKGSLDRMDSDYIQGLASRLGFDGKGRGSGAAGVSADPPAAANDDGDEDDEDDEGDERAGRAAAPIARARDLIGMLYDPDSGLNQEVSDDRASEIMDELLQSLDDVESALSRG